MRPELPFSVYRWNADARIAPVIQDWAVNCAAMSQYHLQNGSFRQSRHFLACASKMAAQVTVPPDANEETKEVVEQQRADIALCWSKYYYNLMEASRYAKIRPHLFVRTLVTYSRLVPPSFSSPPQDIKGEPCPVSGLGRSC